MHVKVEVYIVKVGNIVIKVVYVSGHQTVVEVSRNVIDFARDFKSTVLLLLPIDPNSFLSLLDLSKELLKSISVCTSPLNRVPLPFYQCPSLVFSLNFFNSEACSRNLYVTSTSFLKKLTTNRFFCRYI